ncbi:MAG: hypothetical protein HGA45_18990, partial [Chloroflexales bacterium]|nr:hypothetical protein [Chloroflexales bacterium]
IEQADTPTRLGSEQNPPLTVYDTSGPYTDPAADIDLLLGLAPLRRRWLEERGDTERLPGPSSAYGRQRATDPAPPPAEHRNGTAPAESEPPFPDPAARRNGTAPPHATSEPPFPIR